MGKIEEALKYAIDKHAGQTRKDGSPYIFHPIAVAMRLMEKGMNNDDYIIAALFHDLLEDTDATEDEIVAYGSARVLKVVRLLTKSKDVKSEDYVREILQNGMAKAIKCEDRIHNLQSAFTSDPMFMRRYLDNTREYYLGQFSKELDAEYRRLKEFYERQKDRYLYTVDTSIDNGPVYRTDQATRTASVYDRETGTWVPCDPYFWADLGDNAKDIPAEEAERLIG